MSYSDLLDELGFKNDRAAAKDVLAKAKDPNVGGGDMTESGPYVVHGVWAKDDVRVVVEQNTAPDRRDAGEDEPVAIVTHPKVAVVSGPKATVAVTASDTESLRRMIEAVS